MEKAAPRHELVHEPGADQQHDKERDGQEQVGHAHQHVIEPAPVVAGDGSDHAADHTRGDGHGEAHQQRDASPVQHPGELVAPKPVRPQPVRAARTLPGLEQVQLVEPVLRDERHQERGQADQEEHDEAGDGQLVALEPSQRELPGGEDALLEGQWQDIGGRDLGLNRERLGRRGDSVDLVLVTHSGSSGQGRRT